MHRLDAMPSPYAMRVQPARNAAAWRRHCSSAHEAQWIAWNVCEDTWYRPEDLLRIQDVIDQADPALQGAELLVRCASSLQRLRDMSPTEQGSLPPLGVTHAAQLWFFRIYEATAEDAWVEAGLAGETNPPPLPAGQRLRVVPRVGGTHFRWITFEANGTPVPRDPDHVARSLGLPWGPQHKTVMRVEVPLDLLRAAGAPFVIPTFFDGLGNSPRPPLGTDWRCRPAPEHNVNEPWGSARDMQMDGPALPEIIVEITQAGTMNATCLDVTRTDWSSRPYLQRGAPR